MCFYLINLGQQQAEEELSKIPGHPGGWTSCQTADSRISHVSYIQHGNNEGR